MLNCWDYLRGRTVAMNELDTLQQTLGVSFNNLSLLEEALVHSSYVNENPNPDLVPNERLEFLGDAILGLIIAEKLYQDFPQFTEGKMTKLRAALVRRDTLARLAKNIGLGSYLYLGKGEEASGGRHRSINLAGALEALTAAIFLDSGLDMTEEFILRLFEYELKKAADRWEETDYKSQLQEAIQAREQQSPVYRVIEEVGPDHDKRFTVEVSNGTKVLGRGTGKSKKLAETEAARSALERLSADFTP